MKYLLILFSILSIFGCNRKYAPDRQDTKDYEFIQSRILSEGNVTIPEGTYVITNEIYIPSNKAINFNNSKLILGVTTASVFKIQNNNNITIRNLIIQGVKGKYDLGNYNHKMEKPLIVITNSSNIRLDSLFCFEHCFTPIRLNGSHNITISNSRITDIGEEYPEHLEEFLYSYDGIYIVNEEGQKSNDIKILNCEFKNIGTKNFKYQLNNINKNDGDGIHFQTKFINTIYNIEINKCLFKNCSRRGVKIQAGSEIKLIDNQFIKCNSGIGITQESLVSGVIISSNFIDSCGIGITSNHPFTINNIDISNNHIYNSNFGIRTSGGSMLNNVKLMNNKAENISLCFFDGEISNADFSGNIINGFASGRDKDYYMAFLLAGRSENIRFTDNDIKTIFPSISGVYIENSVKNIKLSDNRITLKKSNTGDRFAIYNHSVDSKNEFKNNLIKLID